MSLHRFIVMVLAGWLCAGQSLRATPEPVWFIGADEDPFASGYAPTDEFSTENYANDPRPGTIYTTASPIVDDDFYFPGTFPIGFNNLTTNRPVLNAETNRGWERALTDGDRTNRVHFFLTSAQVGATSRLRLSCELIWGGIWLPLLGQSGEGFGSHDIAVRFRNSAGQTTLIYSNRLDRDSRIVVDFPASTVAASAGPNTIEFARVGPFTANTGYWIQFDYAQLEADTNALVDADGDGLPRWWEVDNHLSDATAADAATDRDADGLTAGQEYHAGNNPSNPNRADTDGDGLNDSAEASAGTNPNKPDTDGDSISDGVEVNGSPASNPLLADSDADGAPDSLERRVGTSPTSAAIRPTVFRGGIGIHFVSESDRNATLTTNETAGVVPQTHWNGTFPIRTWTRPSGSTADILTPRTNQIVRSDGVIVTNFSLSWTADATDASDNAGSSDRKLMSGFVRAYTVTPVSLTLSNIPFASYDLYVLVGGSYDGQRGRVRLNSDGATDRFFRTTTTAPQTGFIEIKPDQTNHPYGNYVHYPNVSGSTATVTLTNLEGWAVGIHAVQIVDRNLDQDLSGLPDWWELQHALQPGSTALAATDSDGDGLSNSQVHQVGIRRGGGQRAHPVGSQPDGHRWRWSGRPRRSHAGHRPDPQRGGGAGLHRSRAIFPEHAIAVGMAVGQFATRLGSRRGRTRPEHLE
jgi:hypothetical protein